MSAPRDREILVHPDALWSIRSIAKWADYSYSAIAQNFVTQPDFPRPVPQDGSRKPRWRAGDVMAYFGVPASSPAQ